MSCQGAGQEQRAAHQCTSRLVRYVRSRFGLEMPLLSSHDHIDLYNSIACLASIKKSNAECNKLRKPFREPLDPAKLQEFKANWGTKHIPHLASRQPSSDPGTRKTDNDAMEIALKRARERCEGQSRNRLCRAFLTKALRTHHVTLADTLYCRLCKQSFTVNIYLVQHKRLYVDEGSRISIHPLHRVFSSQARNSARIAYPLSDPIFREPLSMDLL